jgi:hypothetical protein
MNFDLSEPPDRIEQRAIDGLTHGICAFRRLRRRLPGLIRSGDSIDVAKAVALLASVQGALALIAPLSMGRLTRQIRRQIEEAN